MHLRGNLSIKELYQKGFISRAAYTVCVREKLPDVVSIAEYGTRYKQFLKLRQCGEKLNAELMALCAQWKARETEEGAKAAPLLQKDPASLTLPELWKLKTGEQQREIENQYGILKSCLPRRSRNLLLALCRGEESVVVLLEILGGPYSPQLQKLLRPGTATGAELSYVTAQVTDLLLQTSANNDARTLPQLRQRLQKLVPCEPGSEMGEFLQLHWDSLFAGNFPLAPFAHLFLRHCSGLNPRHKLAFLLMTDWYTANRGQAAEAVAARLGYSVEGLGNMFRKQKVDVKLLSLLESAVMTLRFFGLCIPASFAAAPGNAYCFLDPGETLSTTPLSEAFLYRFAAMLNPFFRAVEIQTAYNKRWMLFAEPLAAKYDIAAFCQYLHKSVALNISTGQKLNPVLLCASFCSHTPSASEQAELLPIAGSLLQDLYGLPLLPDGSLPLQKGRDVSAGSDSLPEVEEGKTGLAR